MLHDLFSNQILWTTIASWALAQFIKPFLEFLETRRWSWGLWFSSGGNPSSHSALVVSAMLAIGLFDGFDTPVFALSVAIAMVVVYDAAGGRREAGKHAERINTPLEVMAGVLLGTATALTSYILFG